MIIVQVSVGVAALAHSGRCTSALAIFGELFVGTTSNPDTIGDGRNVLEGSVKSGDVDVNETSASLQPLPESLQPTESEVNADYYYEYDDDTEIMSDEEDYYEYDDDTEIMSDEEESDKGSDEAEAEIMSDEVEAEAILSTNSVSCPCLTPIRPTTVAATAGCSTEDQNPYRLPLPCCSDLYTCFMEGIWEYRCESNPTGFGYNYCVRGFRLLSFNIWSRNHRYAPIADMIQDRISPDVANLQEAVGNSVNDIVDLLNAAGRGQWRVANPWTSAFRWCGLNVYRADRWDLEWSREVGFTQKGDSHGVCGALLRRKEDGYRMCVWGSHPVFTTGGPDIWARDAIRRAAWAMNECSRSGTPSTFLCDCNTLNVEAIRTELEIVTGRQWRTAAADGYDHIFTEVLAGVPLAPTTIEPYSGERGCQGPCSNPRWAYSDHPPVYVDVVPTPASFP